MADRLGPLRSSHAALLSTLAIGVPLLALLVFKWYSLEQFEVTAGQLLRLASAQVADAIQRDVQRDFVRMHGALIEQLDHNYVRALDVPRINGFVRSLGEGFAFVDGLFVGEAHSERMFYFPIAGGAGRRRVDARGTIEPDPQFAAQLRRQVDYSASIRRSFDFGEFDHGNSRYHVFVHPLYATRERIGFEGFVGFAVDYRLIWREYIPGVIELVLEQRRSEVIGLDATPVVSIFDEDGFEVYRTGRSLASGYESEVEVPVSFVDPRFLELRDLPPSPVHRFRVRVGYQSGTVDTLVKKRTARERWLWTVSVVLVLTGLVLTARSTYREIRFAETTLDFVSRLSHDAKTPLANIQLFAETLKARRNLPRATAHEYYEILSSQAQRLAHRIGGILEFAKIEAGVRSYAVERVCLKAVLQSTVDAYRYDLARRNLTCELLLPAHEISVMGSPDGLEQLFGNLLDNAIKYSPDAGHVRIAASADQRFVRVSVTDNGIGIPSNEQRKIFGKFYQVKRRSGTPNGCGLGLAIVSHVTRAHRGHVTVSSAPSEGTTFTVHLPLMERQGPFA